MGLALFSQSGNPDLSSFFDMGSQSVTSGQAPDTPQFLKGYYRGEPEVEVPGQPSDSLFLILIVGIGLIYFLRGV